MDVKVADEVWIATALLHREQPARASFRNQEIIERVGREAIYGVLRPGIQVHVSLHSVANKAPNPGAYRMLLETPDGGRRLFRSGDPAHPARGGKTVPERSELPARYQYLLDWYRDVYAHGASGERTQVAERPDAIYAASATTAATSPTNASTELNARPGGSPHGAGGPIDWRDQIVADGSVLLGKPVVRGTRLAVEFLVELLAHGWTYDQILRNYPGLTIDDLRACLAYSAARLRDERVYPLVVV